MIPRVGQDAPDFDVTTSDGQRVTLSALRGRKNVVLYFYPGDFTPVCTRESCGFRDMFEDLSRADTLVLGVSPDSDESHRRFAEHHKLPFPLVSDADASLARRYGARSGLLGFFGMTRRLTFVIDRQGKIAGVFGGELRVGPHLDGVRSLLLGLTARPVV